MTDLSRDNSNPNNCATCQYKQVESEGHCYMFRDEPEEVCMQHTGRRVDAEFLRDLRTFEELWRATK